MNPCAQALRPLPFVDGVTRADVPIQDQAARAIVDGPAWLPLDDGKDGHESVVYCGALGGGAGVFAVLPGAVDAGGLGVCPSNVGYGKKERNRRLVGELDGDDEKYVAGSGTHCSLATRAPRGQKPLGGRGC